VRAEICETLHIDTKALCVKYLGLPALIGADKRDSFEHFIEMIIQCIMDGKKSFFLNVKNETNGKGTLMAF
jgi:hypothetical protein